MGIIEFGDFFRVDGSGKLVEEPLRMFSSGDSAVGLGGSGDEYLVEIAGSGDFSTWYFWWICRLI